MLDHSNDNGIKKLDSGILSPEESEKETFMQLVKKCEKTFKNIFTNVEIFTFEGEGRL